ncbi:MAG: archaeosortase/exosortase family protein [Planctomycetes bacterium]|nr:archaeosortase/exosortase family protein [Planctomycetota bacterium]
MPRRVRGDTLALILQIAAFWPVWARGGERLMSSSEETAWGVLSLITAVVFLRRVEPAPGARRRALIVATAGTLLYALAWPVLPPLLRAAAALAVLGGTLFSGGLGFRWPAGAGALLLLSLPVVPTLQFYLGYPLRVAAAAPAVAMLRLSGFAGSRTGTCFDWGGRLIAVDAPCSGVHMLWVALYLTATLACLFDLPLRRLAASALLALGTVVVCNAFRAAALFVLECGVMAPPAGAHDGIGLAIFAMAAVILGAGLRRLREGSPCASPLSM